MVERLVQQSNQWGSSCFPSQGLRDFEHCCLRLPGRFSRTFPKLYAWRVIADCCLGCQGKARATMKPVRMTRNPAGVVHLTTSRGGDVAKADKNPCNAAFARCVPTSQDPVLRRQALRSITRSSTLAYATTRQPPKAESKRNATTTIARCTFTIERCMYPGPPVAYAALRVENNSLVVVRRSAVRRDPCHTSSPCQGGTVDVRDVETAVAPRKRQVCRTQCLGVGKHL